MSGEEEVAAPVAAPTGEPAEVRSWGWHLMQVSSWLLLVLVPIHLCSTWILHDPGRFGVATLVDRWHSGGWRVFDWTLVVLALLHGGIGLNSMLAGVVRPGRSRTVVAAVIGVVLVAVGLAATSAIFTFDVT